MRINNRKRGLEASGRKTRRIVARTSSIMDDVPDITYTRGTVIDTDEIGALLKKSRALRAANAAQAAKSKAANKFLKQIMRGTI